jgi:prepilin peptidase CpaA
MPLLLPTSSALTAGLVAGAAITASVIDLRTRRVPNVLTLSVALVGVAVAALGMGRIDLVASLAGGLIGLAVMLPGHVIGATGGGDVKLVAALGTLLGPFGTLRAFVAMAIAGGVMALVVAVRRGRLRATLANATVLVTTAGANVAAVERAESNNRFAYAPAIAIGAIVAVLT